MMFERISVCHELLSHKGSFYLHVSSRTGKLLRPVMDEIFGSNRLRSEIAWKRTSAHSDAKKNYGEIWESIFFYTKSDAAWTWNTQYADFDESYLKQHFANQDSDGRRYTTSDLRSPSYRANLVYDYKGYKPHPNGWVVSIEKMRELDERGQAP